MISRSTLIAALVVVELAIVGAGVRSFSGDAEPAGAPAGHDGPAAIPLDRSFATGPAPHVVVDIGNVGVTIEARPEPAVRVVEHLRRHGWTAGHLPVLTAEQTADGVRIALHGEDGPHFAFGGMIEHTLLLKVPAGAKVEVLNADRIEASGLRTRLSAHSDNGSIHVRDHRGAVDAHSDNGRIELVDVQAPDITVHTANGRLVLTRVVADRLHGSTDNGRIEADGVRLADGSLTTQNGRVRLAYSADSDATVSVHSATGRIDVGGGTSDPAAGDETDGGDGHQRVVRLGAARGRFEVSSDNGSIHLNLSQGAQV